MSSFSPLRKALKCSTWTKIYCVAKSSLKKKRWLGKIHQKSQFHDVVWKWLQEVIKYPESHDSQLSRKLITSAIGQKLSMLGRKMWSQVWLKIYCKLRHGEIRRKRHFHGFASKCTQNPITYPKSPHSQLSGNVWNFQIGQKLVVLGRKI